MDVAILAQPGETIRPPIDGGSSITVISHHLARRVAERGAVTIYSRTPGIDVREDVDEFGVRYRRVPDWSDRWNRAVRLFERAFGPVDARRPFFASRWFRAGYARRVIRELDGYDVLHVHNYGQYVSRARRRHPDLGIVLHMHCNWLADLDAVCVEERIRAADAVIGCSSHTSDEIRYRFPHLSDRVETVHPGVDTDFFRPVRGNGGTGEAERRVLMVGRLSPEKGLHVFAKAVAPLLREFSDLRVDLVGGPGFLPYEYLVGLSREDRVAALERFYGRSALDRVRRQLIDGADRYVEQVRAQFPDEAADRVEFHGSVGHRALRAAYWRADVLVNASLSEALGLPILEAMACGVPVVTSDAGGQTDLVVDGTTGRVVPAGDPESLGRALGRFLRDTRETDAMGRAARRRARRRFSWTRMIDRFLGVYRDAARRARGRSTGSSLSTSAEKLSSGSGALPTP